jgi:hypothetical protein
MQLPGSNIQNQQQYQNYTAKHLKESQLQSVLCFLQTEVSQFRWQRKAKQNNKLKLKVKKVNFHSTAAFVIYIYIFFFNPITDLDRPSGFQKVEAPRFQDNRHKKVARLSALRTGHLYPPGNIPGTHFC